MLIFGGSDRQYCSEGFIMTPLTTPHRWQFRLDCFDVFISLQFIFDCSKVISLPDVGFIVNGHKLPLSSRDYIIKEDEDGQVTCFSAIAGLNQMRDDISVWFLGSSFMRAYYTYFDKGNNRVGFARAIH
ncbi:cathepsin d [Plakobranchus ocellatus]|uniref:Cathepsin d n=1 Tax=Plakobranchus ocellatus TaxID=259542 RepID=A0AAV4C0G9_9GAST|nr:cathepsin d [Plakobranchus ocellatus]